MGFDRASPHLGSVVAGFGELQRGNGSEQGWDALLVEAVLGPLRRFAPDISTAKFAGSLARQPLTSARTPSWRGPGCVCQRRAG
jgi:hypothetical protein